MLADRGNMAILLVAQYCDFAQELAANYRVIKCCEFIASCHGKGMDANSVRQLVAT